jgi:MFS family permease
MKSPALPPTNGSLLDDLRALPRPFWVLFAGTFINRFGTFVWPFLTIYLTRQGHSLTAAAVAVSTFGVGNSLGNAFGGWLSDHLGRRNTIVIGTTAAAGFLMLLYTANSFSAVMLWTFITGFANGTYIPANSALITDVVPAPLRMRAFSAQRMAGNAGFACGAATAGIVAKYSFLGLFVGDAFTTLAYAAIAFVALPHGLRGQTAQAPWRAAVRQLRGDRAFHAQFIATFCAALVFAQFGSTFSLHVIQSGMTLDFLGWSLPPESIYGLIIGWNGLLVMSCELPLTSFTGRRNAHRIMAIGYLLIGAGFGAYGLAWNLPLHFLAMTIFTLGEMFSTPVSSAYVSSLAPETMRGRYMGALMLAWGSAGVIGPIAGSLLYQQSQSALWAACAILGVIGAAVILRSASLSRPAREEPLPAPEVAAVP